VNRVWIVTVINFTPRTSIILFRSGQLAFRDWHCPKKKRHVILLDNRLFFPHTDTSRDRTRGSYAHLRIQGSKCFSAPSFFSTVETNLHNIIFFFLITIRSSNIALHFWTVLNDHIFTLKLIPLIIHSRYIKWNNRQSNDFCTFKRRQK